MALYVDSTGDEKKPQLKAPAAGPRPDAGPMDKSELHSLVSGLISSAAQYIDGELSPLRAKATDYYFGRPLGNEEPGRSQFVSTEVRDGVQAVLPSMLRVVFGSERTVEFAPQGPEDVEGADQATEMVHKIFAEENPGFQNTHAMLKDGLVRQLGVWKWWFDESSQITNHKAENVSMQQLELLASDDEVELTRVEQDGEMDAPPEPPAPGQPPAPPAKIPTFSVEFTRTVDEGRIRYAVIPPEEFLYNREDRSLEEAVAVWHRTRKTRGELLAMGIKEKDLEEHGGDDTAVKDNEEVVARVAEELSADEIEAGKANEKHLYCEGFARVDFDGDGIAELRKICTLGPGHYPVLNEPADDINLAIFVPDPEPHTMTGQSWADRLMDLQRYKSMLMRGMSDSLAMSIFPRTVYQSGMVNLADVLNVAPGAPIRATGDPNTVIREFAHSFLGKETLPVIDLVDTINERRTGQNRGVSGLDADALQSSAPGAVEAAVSAAQAQQEMLVRIFAEMALKPLFKGIYKLLIKHQPRKRMAKLRNRWVEVDPRTWNADMDVQVNVALGSGMIGEKIATLDMIATKQAEVMEKAGPSNPIVGWKEYRDTLAEMIELRGKKNTDKYLKPVTQEQLDKMAEDAAKQGPPPSPDMMLAQAQIESTKMKVEADIKNNELKAQRDLMLKQADMAMRWKEIQMEDERERIRAASEDDRERDKQAAEIQLKVKELELKHQMDIREAELSAEIELTRSTNQAGPGEEKSAAPAASSKKRRVQIQRDPETNAMTGWHEEEAHE
jgi:hypothetical protein